MSFDLKSLISTVAPTIASAIGSPMAGLAVSAACEALGLSTKTEEALAGALKGATPDDMLRLKQAEQSFKLEMEKLGIDLEKLSAEAVTSRWAADMGSDSWLAKNIRPIVLIYILSAYAIFAVASGFGFTVTQAYVELLAQWGMIVMSAYFVGRTVEKVITTKHG